MINVAVIPARGGSKRIPGKNIKNFAGKPIISYSIEAAKDSGIFDRIIVSTDSKEIADVSQQAGAEVPFVRPGYLADDLTPTAPVLEHAISWLSDEGTKVKYFCCIYPTAPFLRSEDIKKAFDLLRENKVVEVFSITTFDYCVFRGLKKTENGYLKMFWPENELVRSQDLPEAFHDAGQFYIFDCDAFMKTKTMFNPTALPYFIPRYMVQDIDTPDDWEIAEIMYEACKKKGLL